MMKNTLTILHRAEPQLKSFIALTLIVSTLMVTMGFTGWVRNARAVSLTDVKDVLSDSNRSASSSHTIVFTVTTPVTEGQTMNITLDPNTSAFFMGTNIATSDITFAGGTLQACSGAANEVNVSFTPAVSELTFIVCAGDTIAAGAKTVTIASARVRNPATTGSYVVRINGTMTDSGDTRVAVLPNVTVTAAVQTSFTFTVAELAASTAINGETTTDASTATTIPFGTLSAGVPKIVGQQLTVATNATNGFVVTVQQNQALLSQTGATIDNFQDGASTVSPIAWVSPATVLDQPQTYGHMGLTSDDATLTAGDEFGGSKYAGNLQDPREVFMHTGPADGSTQNKGLAKVAYKVEIGALQEAAADYTNTLTYVATPTF